MLTFSRKLFVLAVIVVAFSHSAADQTHGRRNSIPNVGQLRSDFEAAAGCQLLLVDDKVENSPEVWGAFRHWLAFVKPASPGIYTVKYYFAFPDGAYSRGERTYEFRVLERGCQRAVQPYIGAGNFCMGDTVILPVRLDGYVAHKFTVTKRSNIDTSLEGLRNNWKVDLALPQPPPESVPNPLAEHLKYLGMVRHENLMRSGRVTISYSAIFEAVLPGRFNFSIRPPAHPQGGPVREPDGQAVIVIGRDTPVIGLAQTETTLDFSRRYDSTVGNSNNYQTGTMILQVGDTIAVNYWPGDSVANPRPGETNRLLQPVIRRHVFNPPTENYNAWINDYLPE